MALLGCLLLVSAAAAFSSHERRAWGTGRTPFGFAAYPLLGMLLLAVLVTPALGFPRVGAPAILALGVFLGLFALSSVALRGVASRELPAPQLERTAERLAAGEDERGIGTLEYLIVAVVLVTLFGAQLLGGELALVEKGQLGVGGIKGHIIQLGMGYLLVAIAQGRGQRLVRAGLVVLMLWILAFNQVKYLIFLPVGGALLYRWVSGQLPTWQLVAIGLTVPLGIVTIVYAYFGIAAASSGIGMTLPLVLELARHMVSYLVSGIIGLDQLLREGGTAVFGVEGLRYAFAPFENLVRFVAGNRDYFSVVNPLYLDMHADGRLETNVFTLFGSLLYRGGWVGATAISLAYGLLTYAVWASWRARSGALACAAGSWWMAPLLFTWHDPFFIHLTLIEIMLFLWLRSRLP